MSSIIPTATPEYIDQLFDEIETIWYNDFQRLGELATEARLLAETLGDETRYIKALLRQAWAHQSLDQIERSLSEALEALRLARSLRLPELETRATGLLAGSFYLCGLSKEAQQLYQRQLDLSIRSGNLAEQRLALHDMSLTYMQNEVDVAMELLKQALSIMEGVTQRDWYIIHASYAYRLALLGHLDEARDIGQELLVISPTLGPNLHANTNLLAAFVEIASENLDLALFYINRAKRENGLADRQHINNDLMYINYLYTSGQYAEVFAKVEQVYQYAFETGLVQDGLRALDMARLTAQQIKDSEQLVQVYKLLIEEVPRAQERSHTLRLQVLAMVFAEQQAAQRQQLLLSEQNAALLQRIAHEFRTPLTVIQSSAEMVDTYGEKMPLERRAQHLKNITGQVRSMGEMLENISVLFDEYAPSMLPASSGSVPLEALTAGVLNRLTGAAMPAERVIVRGEGAVGYDIATTLEIIAYHLVHNALRYSTDTVHFDITLRDRAVTLRVEDTGIGIPADEQQAVFEPLVRGSNQHEPTGGGLGLAIVAKLVNELRATLHLTSTEQHGTTIQVSAPLKR